MLNLDKVIQQCIEIEDLFNILRTSPSKEVIEELYGDYYKLTNKLFSELYDSNKAFCIEAFLIDGCTDTEKLKAILTGPPLKPNNFPS